MTARTSDIAEIIRWTLEIEGPSDTKTIKRHLISHPELAYVALREDYLDAKILEAIQLLHWRLKFIYMPGVLGAWSLTHLGQNSKLFRPKPLPQHIPWLEFGIGKESVYGLINNSHMYNLVSNGSCNFPIKIGRTNRSIQQRIQELQTGSFLDLRLGFLINTENSKKLEQYIHKALLNNRSNSNYGQKEWFNSNFAVIKSLYKDFELASSLETINLA